MQDIRNSMAEPAVVGSSLSLLAPHSPDRLLSPVSELTHCFTGLSAFQTGDTPRRCLDLSNVSTGSADAGISVGSPQNEAPTDQCGSLPVPLDSPAPRNSRMKLFQSFLPRLLSSSPKQDPSNNNKENVRVENHFQGPDPLQQGTSEPYVLGSPISCSPPGFLRDKDGFIEVLEDQEAESSVAVCMSSSMAQLLSDPLMNQEVDLSSVSVCHRGSRRLFRSPSMPERLNRVVLKRASQSPAANPPLKRHRTFSAISEDEGEQKGCSLAVVEGRKRPYLLKKTLSLCELAQHLGGEAINAELIGDFSKVYALPTVTGRHQDLKYITGETMCALLKGEFTSLVESFVVVDCRYPYEYQGGHIKGALNLPNTDEAVAYLLQQKLRAHCLNKRLVLVLHCEFSSERAPRTCRLLRREDRSVNEYPALHYPELYILKGGYRDFFHLCQEQCEPQSYCPMHHEDHRQELLKFRTHGRASAEDRRRRQLMTRLIKL